MQHKWMRLLPIAALLAATMAPDARGQVITNAGFENGLSGWTFIEQGDESGQVFVENEQAVFLKNSAFLITLQQTFTMPPGVAQLSFDIFYEPGFDETDAFMPAAFEAQLLDSNLDPVVPAWKPAATAFFNVQENRTVNLGPGVSYDGQTVIVGISGIALGKTVTLYFNLVGADGGAASGVRIDGVQLLACGTDADCEDGDSCTIDSCVNNECVQEPSPACEITVGLDIKPESCPDPIQLRGGGVLPVSVVGSVELDVTQIDPASVMLSREDAVGGSVAPSRWRIEDVATPFEGELCDCHEVGSDGIEDLSLKFRKSSVIAALELEELPGGTFIELVVSGLLQDGTAFVASDCVRINPH